MDKYHEIARYQGSYTGYISDIFVRDNTKDPFTGKYILQYYGQYNVGILLIRFIQLYSLSQQNPAKYDFQFNHSINTFYNDNIRKDYLKIVIINAEGHITSFKDLPQEVHFYLNTTQDENDIVLMWPLQNRKDKLYRLSLNEDTEVISVHFRGDRQDVIKSSDGRVEYVAADVTTFNGKRDLL